MGLIARRGVSIRNGYWDPNRGRLCDPNDPNGPRVGVRQQWNTLWDHTYMSYHMGNGRVARVL